MTPAMLRSIFDLDAAVSIHPIYRKTICRSAPGIAGDSGKQSQGTRHLRGRHRCRNYPGPAPDGMQGNGRGSSHERYGLRRSNEVGITCITEPPFSPITESSRVGLTAQIAAADVVVLTATPVGKGNLDNIRILAEATKTPVLFLSDDGRATLPDYTEGKATAFLNQMMTSQRLAVLPLNQLLDRCKSKEEKQP